MARGRIFAGVLALALVAMACSGAPGPSPSPTAPTPTGTGSPSAPPTTGPSPATTSLEVWFSSMTGGGAGASNGPFLFETHRALPTTATPATDAVTALLEGPSAAEGRAGLTTAIPPGTALLGLSIANGIATVDLSNRFGSGGGSESVFMRLAQVVYTLTQFPSVDRVRFLLGGKPVRVFSSEGVILAHPSTRGDFADRLPPVSVESPGIGERITSPVRVSGTANVFEGTVSIRILDAHGHVIASTFTTATCGSGCRGTFSKRVPFHVGSTREGTVQAFEVSMRNGRPQFVVSIPVTLVG